MSWTHAYLGLVILLQSLKSLFLSWSYSLMQTCGFPCHRRDRQQDGRPFDGKSVLIVSLAASDLLLSLIRQILQSDIQSLVIVSPDVSGFLQHVWGQVWEEEEDGSQVRDRRLFFQPIPLSVYEEKIDSFVHNLRQNEKLKLDDVLLLPDDEKDGLPHFPVQYFLLSLHRENLLQPHTGVLIASSSLRNLFRVYTGVNGWREAKERDIRMRWMLIGDTSRLSITNVPRLVSLDQGISLFFGHWISFVRQTFFAMNPDYMAGIITDRMAGGAQTEDSIFIYGKPVK